MTMPEVLVSDSQTKRCPKCGEHLEAWASICPKCMYEWPDKDISLNPEEQNQVEAVSAFDAELEKDGTQPVVVYGLVAINILVYIGMVLNGTNAFAPSSLDLFRFGGNFPPATVHGQWWRMLSSNFIHAGVIHIGFNMYILWVAGRRMERILGHTGFLITYLLSGLLGSVASLAFHAAHVTVGASGAIFGIYGALLGFLVRDRNSISRPVFLAIGKSTLIFLAYNLLFGLQVKNIDLSAHIGGLAGGFLCGLALSRPLGESDGALRRYVNVATSVAGLLVVCVMAVGVTRLNGDDLAGGEKALETAGLAQAMKKILQDHFDTEKTVSGVRIQFVRIERLEGQDYSGTVKISWYEKELNLPIHFRVEGDQVRWELLASPIGKTGA